MKRILDSIDIGSPIGKRDYAIILLIARSGLRASDVADLRFSDIDWDKQRIHRIQLKTKKAVDIPLLNDVCEALVNYLKNGCPAELSSDRIFVMHKTPFTHFGAGNVGNIVSRNMVRAGVKSSERKCGSHALRHTLASRLLECNVPMPVISEILGHSDTNTTMTYLCIGGECMNAKKKDPEMVGVFSGLAYSFIEYKRSQGFKYEAEPKCISQFCRFAEEKGIDTIEITKNLAYEWCAPREHEACKSRSHRLTCVRQFAIYLSDMGYSAYIMPEQKFTVSYKSFTPYIFTKDKIDRLIKAVDQTKECKAARNMHLSFPVIFRLLYGCGMRVSEVCTMKVRDVDLVKGVLILKNRKNGTDRYISLSESV